MQNKRESHDDTYFVKSFVTRHFLRTPERLRQLIAGI